MQVWPTRDASRLAKVEMPDRPEAEFLQGEEELVGVFPAVETDAVTIRFEHPIKLGERREQPADVIVVQIRAANRSW